MYNMIYYNTVQYDIYTVHTIYCTIDIKLTEDEVNNQFVLDVACPRYAI